MYIQLLPGHFLRAGAITALPLESSQRFHSDELPRTHKFRILALLLLRAFQQNTIIHSFSQEGLQDLEGLQDPLAGQKP